MVMTSWPTVLNEVETLNLIHKGMSCARFGDGEISIIHGGEYVREPRNAVLSAELKDVLQNPHPRCLPCIPTMNPAGAKYQNWRRRQGRFLNTLNPGVEVYGSAFISRPDSAQWIRTREYAERVVSLWRGKRTALVSESGVAIHRLLKRSLAGGKLIHIECPHRQTYNMLDDIEKNVFRARPEIALLSCGPSATCLANRLAGRGIHAVDIGSIGGFMLKELFSAMDTLRAFALGVQRTGTTSLGSALTKAGFQVAHNRPKWLGEAKHTGVYLTEAHARGDDPCADMPGVGAIVHPSVCVLNPEPINLWPQMDLTLLDSLRKHYPACVFILNTRPIDHWIRSITGWKNFRQRITDADIPGLPAGVGNQDDELRAWMGWHYNRMRDFFSDSPKHFVEINIEEPEQTRNKLSQALNRDIGWPWLNRKSS